MYCGSTDMGECYIYFYDIYVGENEVLLLKYNGTNSDVYIPDVYTIDGTEYNVILLSYYYSESRYEGDDWTPLEGVVFYENDIVESVFLDDNIDMIYSEYNDDEDAVNYYNEVDSAESLFFGCDNLKSVLQIPATVTYMNRTFSGCTSLTGTVRINASDVYFAYLTFGGTNKSIAVEVPAGSTTYTTFSNEDMPSNVTLSTFNAG